MPLAALTSIECRQTTGRGSDLPGGGVVRIEAPEMAAGLVRMAAETSSRVGRTGGERLRLLYGGAATFSLREHGGTVEARIGLPMDPV